ncbi:polynucleotide kinase-phosphatase [Verrucomicrobiaceae bacterium 227]
MKLHFPELSLILLIGPSGSGKSSFAKKHFLPTEVISSDTCRGLVSDDENNQLVSGEAFALLEYLISIRLKLGRLTVVDATNVDPTFRKQLITLARQHHCLPAAIVFKIDAGICHAHNARRPDRDFGPHVVRRQISIMRRGLKGLKREGFRKIHTLNSAEEIDAIAGITRDPLWNNKQEIEGPFDIIGDVHGCYDELRTLLAKLDYQIEGNVARHPERTLVFVGDLIDRGPDSPKVLRLVMESVAAGTAYCVPGNHDAKLLRHLNGKKVALTHGLDLTVDQLEKDPIDQRDLCDFLHSLVSHLVFDGGRLVVAHAGIKEEMIGRGSGAIREMCLYGDTTGEKDEYGFPVRLDWSADYRGRALVVYGHTPVGVPRWLNRTVNIDTGCVFGGELSALRYPENETVSTPALQTYAESPKPFKVDPNGLSPQQHLDTLLDLDDVIGHKIVDTRYLHNLTIREENAIAALEVMSRFAIDPRWLIYLPPTMSPCATSPKEGWLERPEEAFAYFQSVGQSRLICEEKHMGSRANIVIVRDQETARTRFGINDGTLGAIYSRTGRAFFKDPELSEAILNRLRRALDETNFWEEQETNWACLDCEIMPWSAKAQDLLTRQYAPVGAAGELYTSAASDLLEKARHPGLETLSGRITLQQKNVQDFRAAYRPYCWDTPEIDDYKIAPFHLLATEGQVHTDKTHTWHMDFNSQLVKADPALFQPTRSRLVDLNDPASTADATQWWEDLTAKGGEGMVVKPDYFLVKGERGLLQPAVKCRGKEYLRIIYGPDYLEARHLKQLKNRGLKKKQSLALREFSLGLEALHRFVERAPLRKVHECVFSVLALESEPIDPRL